MNEQEIQQLRAEVAQITWYHTFDLGHGVVTPGMDNSPKKLSRLRFPDSFAGKTVLDVGASQGFFSFEAEKRGAQRVLATDSFHWLQKTHITKAGFDLAKKVYQSKVEEKLIDVLELSPAAVGTFDVVLFLGVLYHMKHPLLALEKAASVTKDMMILETVVDMLGCRRPAMAYYAGTELSADPTNWCGPNPAAVAAMLRTVGFKRIEVVAGIRPWWFRAARAFYYWKTRGVQMIPLVRTDRIVIHAWK
jgi:tRNA (mo5U34)-methyltransferase